VGPSRTASVPDVNAAAVSLLVAAAASALVDWWAAGTGRHRIEAVVKPLTMVLLIATAIAVDAATVAVQAWFIVALILSLAGDGFLLPQVDNFIAGLASFLLAHIAYVVGLAAAGLTLGAALIGAGIAFVATAVVGRRIHEAASRSEPALAIPVAAYIAVISVMFAGAVATTNAWAIAGGALFYTSDAVLGWNRFVGPIGGGRVATMAAYHSAQALFVISLVTL